MMKWAFIVVLLQLCYAFHLNVNLNKEIIHDLRALSGKVTFPKTSPIPGILKSKNPSHCLGTYSKELRHLLMNVTQKKASVENTLKQLDLNLEHLEKRYQHDSQCNMTNVSKDPLNDYIKLFRKLNNGR